MCSGQYLPVKGVHNICFTAAWKMAADHWTSRMAGRPQVRRPEACDLSYNAGQMQNPTTLGFA